MTTIRELSAWFDRGVEQSATHMIVVCDDYDHNDYPVYVSKEEDVRERETHYREASMQRVMEVYNLAMDKTAQMNERRAFHYETTPIQVQPVKFYLHNQEYSRTQVQQLIGVLQGWLADSD